LACRSWFRSGHASPELQHDRAEHDDGAVAAVHRADLDRASIAAGARALRALGIGIALDDFGVGYSSLSYLARLPVDPLKVDRSFVVSITDDSSQAIVVRSIVSLAQSLRVKVIAEGVETEEQARILALLGCDQLQGYLFNRPLSASEVASLPQKRP